MDTATARNERAFTAFAHQGDFITLESYAGAGRRLAAIQGQDPESPAVARLTEVLEAMWAQLSTADSDQDGRIGRIEGAFASLDHDGDGTLSSDEFSACGRSYWTSTDPNRPGSRWMGP